MLFKRMRANSAGMMRAAAIALCVALLMPDALHRRPSSIKPRDAFAPASLKPAREAAPEEFEDTEGRNDWFTTQRACPFETIPADARRRAFDALSRMRTQSLVHIEAARRWQPIGPAPTFSAYMANWGNTSGRINAIAVSPADSRLVILGS